MKRAAIGILILAALACSPTADSQTQRELAESRKANDELQKKLDETQAKLIAAEKMLGKSGAMQSAVDAPADVPFIHEERPIAQTLPQEAPADRGHVSFGSEPGSSNAASGSASTAMADAYAASNFTHSDEVARAKCAKDWPTDFHMQKVCLDQQTAAVSQLENGRPAGVDGDTFATIRSKCATDWPNDFHMRTVCENQQEAAAKALGSH